MLGALIGCGEVVRRGKTSVMRAAVRRDVSRAVRKAARAFAGLLGATSQCCNPVSKAGIGGRRPGTAKTVLLAGVRADLLETVERELQAPGTEFLAGTGVR